MPARGAAPAIRLGAAGVAAAEGVEEIGCKRMMAAIVSVRMGEGGILADAERACPTASTAPVGPQSGRQVLKRYKNGLRLD